ncbi:MAG TPA: hypothetical protein VJ819_07050 [Nocardioidaceae bacterium]|nr:hypothetical protein [Nocardioidaceae bacterium]
MGHTLAVAAAPHDARAGRDVARWRERAVTFGSAAATLAVILSIATLSQSDGVRGFTPEDPTLLLTDLGRRALDELPLSYQAEDAVVVPASTDPSMEWTGRVPQEWIEGSALPLGARGLMDYDRLSSSSKAPAWTLELSDDDRVFTDVGPLWFACVTWPGGDTCSPSVLMYHDLEYFFYASHFGSTAFLDEGTPMEVFTFDAVGGTELGQVLVGGVHGTDIVKVRITMSDGEEQSAWTSNDLAVPGGTVWWTTVWEPAESATAYDRDGEVVTRVSLPSRR